MLLPIHLEKFLSQTFWPSKHRIFCLIGFTAIPQKIKTWAQCPDMGSIRPCFREPPLLSLFLLARCWKPPTGWLLKSRSVYDAAAALNRSFWDWKESQTNPYLPHPAVAALVLHACDAQRKGSQSCSPVLVLVLLFRFCLSLPPNHLLNDVTNFTVPQIPSHQLPIPYHTNRRVFSYRNRLLWEQNTLTCSVSTLPREWLISRNEKSNK